jgi:hypothetical protein
MLVDCYWEERDSLSLPCNLQVLILMKTLDGPSFPRYRISHSTFYRCMLVSNPSMTFSGTLPFSDRLLFHWRSKRLET